MELTRRNQRAPVWLELKSRPCLNMRWGFLHD